MRIVATDPDSHLASIEDETIRATMTALDDTIRAALPDRARDLWQGVFWGGTEQTIIGYGRITQPRPRRNDVDWFLVGLARQKRNYSLYINAAHDNHYLAHQYTEQLGNVKLGAASITFTKLDNINLDTLTQLLTDAHERTPADTAQ